MSHKLPLILTNKEPSSMALLLANLSSFVFDFVVRTKLGGMDLCFFIVKQLPVIPPEAYPEDIRNRIAEIVLRLVYSSYDISSFARDCGFTGSPFAWDRKSRHLLLCEMDAIFALLYGVSREELEYRR